MSLATRMLIARVFTGKPCKYGHIADRFRSNRRCVECAREQQRARYAGDSAYAERRLAWHKAKRASDEGWASRRRNRTMRWQRLKSATDATWIDSRRALDRERKRVKYANDHSYAEATRERERKKRDPAKKREATKAWRQNNPALATAQGALRKARKLNATPPWADLKAIAAIYAEAKRLTAATGVIHHVDHEIPLKGKKVCGLHVEGNLRAIQARDNIQKGSRFAEGGTL